MTAFDKTTRSRANISITASTGHRSPEEIERMVEEAERLKKDDDARAARIEARNELEALLYHAKGAVAEATGVAAEEARAVIAAVEAWSNDTATPATPTSAWKAKIAEIEAALGRA